MSTLNPFNPKNDFSNWKQILLDLVLDFETEVYSLAMERYEGGEYHPNVSTSGREHAEKAIRYHLESLNSSSI